MMFFAPSARFTASLMKHGREANILSSIQLCTLLLIVNLRSYDTKVRLDRPRCRVIEFGCAIFEDAAPPNPPCRRCDDVHLKACRSERRSFRFCRSNDSWSGEWKYEICSPLQSGGLSGGGVQFILVLFLFCQPFISGISTEHGCSSSAVPSFPFTQTKRTHLLVFIQQLHWSSWGIEAAVIIKVFPSLSAGFIGMLINTDDSTITLLWDEKSLL